VINQGGASGRARKGRLDRRTETLRKKLPPVGSELLVGRKVYPGGTDVIGVFTLGELAKKSILRR